MSADKKTPQRDGAEPVAATEFSDAMDSLCDDYAKYANGDPKMPWAVVRDSVVVALNAWNHRPPDERDAEIARLRDENARWSSMYGRLSDQHEAARAQCDAFKADAERIDWLEARRNPNNGTIDFEWTVNGYRGAFGDNGGMVLVPFTGYTLRAAIDAMRAREGENGNG